MTTAIRQSAEHATLLDALLASFADATKSPSDVTPPAAILWPDPERRWQPLVARLRETFPFVYSLGVYSPETRSGPSIWLRCIVDRTLKDLSPPRETTPVCYLPGVSRQLLRAGSECPSELQPLIELQFRGRVWHQPSGQEWTVEAFLSSRHGIGLDVARDSQTRESVYRTLALLADTDLSALRERRLHAADFDALAVEDPVRDLLRWMNDPEGTRRALDDMRWQALSSRARAAFGFDPAIDPPLAAADRLVAGDRRWNAIWNRFAENPRIYPGVARVVRDADAQVSELGLDAARRPSANVDAEEALGVSLKKVAALPHHEACAQILALEAAHAPRRRLVWAQLGESPLAMALEPLARLASLAQSPVAGHSVEVVAATYSDGGWNTDAAAIQAMASVSRPADVDIVNGVVNALYLPWLDASARALQRAMIESAVHSRLSNKIDAHRDTCLLFADGLRFDVGVALKAALESRGLTCRLTHRLAAIPTATPTAKPAVSPVSDELTGTAGATDFAPVIRETGQSSTAERLRDLMTRRDVTVFASDDVQPPLAERGGWTECGEIDALGHKIGVRLARQLSSEIEEIADRVSAIIEGGWPRVRVLTDHGWLLLPGGLPKTAIPKSVTSTRWARCALVSGESATDMPVLPWHWNANVRIASPPGAGSFIANCEYAHGGVSPQECVVPELLVQRGSSSVTPSISDVKWARLRCRVTVRDAEEGSTVDIRLNWKDVRSSIVASPRTVDEARQVSVVVPDDQYEGAAAVVVLLDSHGTVVGRVSTTVGGDA